MQKKSILALYDPKTGFVFLNHFGYLSQKHFDSFVELCVQGHGVLRTRVGEKHRGWLFSGSDFNKIQMKLEQLCTLKTATDTLVLDTADIVDAMMDFWPDKEEFDL